jgi:hypothetical protein
MSEALLACGRCRYCWVASAPYPPYKGGALLPRRYCCSTIPATAHRKKAYGLYTPPHSGSAYLAAPELQRLWSIVLTWSPPVYRSDGHLSEGRLASLHARRQFLRLNFVESVRARFAAYIGQEQALSSPWLWFGRQPWRSGGLELRSSPQRNVHIG